ncbi:Glycosyl transferase, group 1 [Chitinispirillum alkaliphilum]|nr:Glycosyl transferase, group 1 [Chitinispirillum alkaliphilum]
MKIALVNSEYPNCNGAHGGIASLNYTLANSFAKNGNHVTLLLRKGTVPGKLLPSIQTVHYEYEAPSFPKKVTDLFRNGAIAWECGHARQIRHILIDLYAKGELDIVLVPEYGGMAHQLYKPLPFPVVVIFCMPSELVDEVNTDTTDNTRQKLYRFEAKAIKRADAYVCFMDSIMLWLKNRYKLSEGKIKIIKTPIDITQQRKSDINKNEFNLLFAGRLEHRKGAGIIVKCIKQILRCDSNIRLTFAGETTCHNDINYKIKIENILSDEEKSRVKFLGHIKREELFDLYTESYALIIPSLFDNCPNILLEAMAAGLPIIGSDATGIKEFIKHEVNGLLFPLSSAHILVDHIKRIVSDRKLAERLGNNGYRYVRKSHSSKNIVSEYLSYFQSVMNRKK